MSAEDKTSKKGICKGKHWGFTVQLDEKYKIYHELDVDEDIIALAIAEETGGEEKIKKHLHGYIKYIKKINLEQIKTIFKRLINNFDEKNYHFETIRSDRNYIKYISKEDDNIIYKNIKYENFHYYKKMKDFIKKNRNIDNLSSFIMNLPTQYTRKFNNAHKQYWNDNIKSTTWKTIEDIKAVNKLLVKDIHESDKLGVYIFGKTGTGKTVTAIATAIDSFMFFELTSVNFPLTDYNDEQYILIDEWENKHYEHFRSLILKVTSGLPFHVAHKGGKGTLHHNILKKLIITSNDDPPDDLAFRRRFDIYKM